MITWGEMGEWLKIKVTRTNVTQSCDISYVACKLRNFEAHLALNEETLNFRNKRRISLSCSNEIVEALVALIEMSLN